MIRRLRRLTLYDKSGVDRNSAASSCFPIIGVQWTDACLVKNLSHEHKLMLLQYAARKLSRNRGIIGSQRCNLM